jgi:predicted acetyltransferase
MGRFLGRSWRLDWVRTVTVEVRSIAAGELDAWVAAIHVAFHVDRSTAVADEAAFRRDALQQDLSRTYAAVDGQHVAGTMFSFPAELALPGGTRLPADAITSATVLPTYRRRGLLTRMLTTDLRAAQDRGDAAAILVAAEFPIYSRFGFGPATEQATYTLRPAQAAFKHAATGRVDLVPAERLRDVAPPIFDQFRRGRPGQIDRSPIIWDTRLGLRQAPWSSSALPLRCATYTDLDGTVQGYLTYRVDGTWERRLPTGSLEITELVALTPDAYLGLWRYCCDVDLVRQVTAPMRSVDEPLGWLLHDARAAVEQTSRSDLLWLRPLDVPAALSARRYLSEARLVVEVADPLGLCDGRFAIEGGPDGATCHASDASADLSLGLPALGALILGGASPTLLAQAGAIEEQRPGALAVGERLFRWPLMPWCSTFF